MIITYEMIKKAVKQLKKASYRNDYLYRTISPNEGKFLEIYGPVGPMQAAEMFADVWSGKSKVEDCPYMREVENLLIFKKEILEEEEKDDAQGVQEEGMDHQMRGNGGVSDQD